MTGFKEKKEVSPLSCDFSGFAAWLVAVQQSDRLAPTLSAAVTDLTPQFEDYSSRSAVKTY